MAGKKKIKQRGPRGADMHKARGTRRYSGANLTFFRFYDKHINKRSLLMFEKKVIKGALAVAAAMLIGAGVHSITGNSWIGVQFGSGLFFALLSQMR